MKIKKRNIAILTLVSFVVLSMNAQKSFVHGKVTLFNSIAIEKAEITVKKTKNSVFTDSLGFFTIECEIKDKLSIKAAGFKKLSVKIKNLKDSVNVDLIVTKDERDIELAASKGHINKNEVGLAIKHFNTKPPYSLGYTNMMSLIKGKFPQINIVKDEIILRGKNSFTNADSFSSKNGAVIVLNGIISDISSLKSIIVTEVKDIKILSGSEATRYGPGSGNGVLLVRLNSN